MVNPVSPSAAAAVTTITTGQISKLYDLLSAGLRKSGLSAEQSQRVIERQGESIVAGFVADFRKRVEAIGNLIVRHVVVNRKRTSEEAIAATGRVQYVDERVVAAMPLSNNQNNEFDVYFFTLSRFVSDAELEKEYELRGLVPADLYAVAAINEADPAFADTNPNGTPWKDAQGKWCFAVFGMWNNYERGVYVSRGDCGWSDEWWFAGVLE